MTTEEKAKAYDEALEKAKKFHTPESNNTNLKAVLELIFPELNEYEDEMIRKTLVEYFGPKVQLDFVRGVPVQKIRDWLEKQKDIFGERAKNITANMLEDGIEGIQRELIEFLSNTVNASWVDIIKSADAYAQRIRSMLEKQKGQNVVPSRETILGIWELGNLWKENPEERVGLTQLQYIQKYWFEKCDYQKEQKPEEDWIENRKRECPFMKIIDNNLYGCARYNGAIGICDGRCSWVVDYQKLKEIQDKRKQKPSISCGHENDIEWSEKDEEMLDAMIDIVSNSLYEPLCPREEMLTWLKSRRLSWMPTEEQMGALNYAYCELFKRGEVSHNILGPLQILIDTLRKLM